jgi:hypothetical protein
MYKSEPVGGTRIFFIYFTSPCFVTVQSLYFASCETKQLTRKPLQVYGHLKPRYFEHEARLHPTQQHVKPLFLQYEYADPQEARLFFDS